VETRDMKEITVAIVALIKASGLPCFVLGDEDEDVMYSVVFGTYEAAQGALEAMNVPGAKILAELREKTEEGYYEEKTCLH
jgi:hypothetical protein